MNIAAIAQPVAFLNGSVGLNGPEEVLHFRLLTKGIRPIIIDDLYQHPENLLQLKESGIKTLIIQTTGQNWQDVMKAVEFFKNMDYVTENIVMIFPDMLYRTIGEFKKDHPEMIVYEWFMTDSFSEFEF